MATAAQAPQAEASTISYPLEVHYCGVCSFPIEYCEFRADYDKCKEWLKNTLPDVHNAVMAKLNDQLQSVDIADGKKRQTRGGKAIRNKKKASGPKQVTFALSQRSKKKYVTVVVGLKTFEIDLKKASKYFAQTFSCGSSVTGDDEIVIQGDVTDNIIDTIQKKWPEIDDDSITDLGEQKR